LIHHYLACTYSRSRIREERRKRKKAKKKQNRLVKTCRRYWVFEFFFSDYFGNKTGRGGEEKKSDAE